MKMCFSNENIYKSWSIWETAGTMTTKEMWVEIYKTYWDMEWELRCEENKCDNLFSCSSD